MDRCWILTCLWCHMKNEWITKNVMNTTFLRQGNFHLMVELEGELGSWGVLQLSW